MKVDWQRWQNTNNIDPQDFICGYCGRNVGSHTGYFNNSNPNTKIYICPFCGMPTLFYQNKQYPGPLLGRNIENLPSGVAEIYRELKDTNKNSSFTAVSLLGRKLIMHLAVNVARAKEGEKFVQYVEYLKKSGYIPPNGDKILKYIKDLGNEKNHEIKIGTKEEAEKIIKFIEALLIFMYEFPSEFQNKENKQ